MTNLGFNFSTTPVKENSLHCDFQQGVQWKTADAHVIAERRGVLKGRIIHYLMVVSKSWSKCPSFYLKI